MTGIIEKWAGELEKHARELALFPVFSFKTNIRTDNSCAVGEVTPRFKKASVILVDFFFCDKKKKKKHLISLSG